MYAITARIGRKDGAYMSMREVPTFYLDERVQGIMSEDHARRIAEDILDPYGMADELHVSAVKVD